MNKYRIGTIVPTKKGWQYRDTIGRYASNRIQRIKAWTVKAFHYTVEMTKLGLVVVGVFLAGLIIGHFVNTRVVTAVEKQEVIVDTLKGKIEELKGGVIDKLIACESGSFKESDAPIVFDTNSKASIGVAQFQKKTVQHYIKTLHGETISAKEAVLIALDAEKSKELAREIIFTTDKGLSNWHNCSTKLGLEKEVAFIKKLEQ